MMPTGGVDLTTAESFLKAGACCLGVGGSLVEPKAVASGDFARIRDLAGQFAAIVRGSGARRERPRSRRGPLGRIPAPRRSARVVVPHRHPGPVPRRGGLCR